MTQPTQQVVIRSRFDPRGYIDLENANRRVSRSLSGVASNAEKTLSGFNRAVLGIRTGLIQTAGGFILGALIQDATRAVTDFGKSFIDVNSDVQQFKLQFSNLFKSIGLDAEKAAVQTERAFAFAKQVARETPFDLPEITQGILRLQTFGISVERVLGRAIDLAAALGKPLEEATTAFTNLQSRRFGESFEQFARLGIARDLLEGKGLEFDRNGSYRGSVEQAMQAITEIIDERFAGFADSQQGTFKQLQSNLGDLVFQFKEAFGAPVFAGINEDLREFVGLLDENQPAIEGFATAFGELLEGARSTASDAFTSIFTDLRGSQETTIDDFFEFGVNLIVAFADGMLSGARFTLEAATVVAGGIARFFEAFSPPKEGPLKEIDVWGANLINTYFEGMQNANFGLLDEVLNRIADVFNSQVSAGLIDTETPAQDFLSVMEDILDSFGDIEAGGEAAHEVFESLSEVIGDAAFDIEAFVEASRKVAEVTAELEAANAELERIRSTNDTALDSLEKELGDARRADNARRKEFDKQQDAAREAAEASAAQARVARQAMQEAQEAQRDSLNAQIDSLENQKDQIEKAADAAVAALEAEKDSTLAPLEAAIDALEVQTISARRALEDFNFETEGIPERFTRQRRRELERILTLREREEQDAKRAFSEQREAIDAAFKAQKEAIEENARLQKEAIDAQIDGLRDQIRAIQDLANAESDLAGVRAKREKFVEDPRIAELEELIRLEKERADKEEEDQKKIVDDIQARLDIEKQALDDIQEKIDARLTTEGFIADALEEQRRIAEELAKLAEAAARSNTNRVLDEFGEDVDGLNSKIDEARAKLADLIPQATRDKFKQDIRFFADFFKGLANIRGADSLEGTQGIPGGVEAGTTEGFLLGQEFRGNIRNLGNAFQQDVIPKLETMAELAKNTADAFGDILDFVDKIKAVIAGGFEALGLQGVADVLNTPIRDAGLTLGAYIIALRLLTGGVITYTFAIKYIEAIATGVFRWLFGIIGIGGTGTSIGGASAAGATIPPIAIAASIIISLALLYKYNEDFRNIVDEILEFVKNDPLTAILFTAGLAAALFIPAAAPIGIGLAVAMVLANPEEFGDIGQALLNFMKKNPTLSVFFAAGVAAFTVPAALPVILSIGVLFALKENGINGFDDLLTALNDFVKNDPKTALLVGAGIGTASALVLGGAAGFPVILGLALALAIVKYPGESRDLAFEVLEFIKKDPVFALYVTAAGLAFFFPGAAIATLGVAVVLDFYLKEPIAESFNRWKNDPVGAAVEGLKSIGTMFAPNSFTEKDTVKVPIPVEPDFVFVGPLDPDRPVARIGGTILDFVKNIVGGLTGAFQNNSEDLKAAGESVGDNILAGMNESLEIESPSKKTAEIGQLVIEGLRDGMQAAITELMPQLLLPFQQFFDSLKALYGIDQKDTQSLFHVLGTLVIETFAEGISQETNNAQNAIDTAFTSIRGQIYGIFGYAGNRAEAMYQLGVNVVNSFVSGLQQQTNAQATAIKNAGQSVYNNFTQVWKTGSPSRTMIELGHNIVSSLGIGMEDEQGRLFNLISNISNNANGQFNLNPELPTDNLIPDDLLRLGERAAELYAEGFNQALRRSLIQSIGPDGFLNVKLTNINVNVTKDDMTQTVKTRSKVEAARLVGQIISEGGDR